MTTPNKKLDQNDSLAAHLDAARAEMGELDKQREVVQARIDALEVAAGLKPALGFVVRGSYGAKTPARVRSASPRTGSGKRAPAGSWKIAARTALKGKKEFTYKELQEVAKELGMDVPLAQVRIQVSKMKRLGILEQSGTPGAYKATPEGKGVLAAA